MASPAWPPPTMIVSINSDTSKSFLWDKFSTVASVRQSKRLLRHLRAVTRDLLPFAAHLDESVRGDDGVRAMFALEQNVIGVLVGRHRRIAVHAHLELRKFLAVCLEVLCVGHKFHDFGFGVKGSVAIAPGPVLSQSFLVKGC